MPTRTGTCIITIVLSTGTCTVTLLVLVYCITVRVPYKYRTCTRLYCIRVVELTYRYASVITALCELSAAAHAP